MTLDVADRPRQSAGTRRSTGDSPAAREARLFLWMALACVLVAFVGFVPTFWKPLARGTFHANPIVYAHGALFSGWTVLLAAQTWLVWRHDLRLHRALGTIGIAFATLVATSGFLVLMNVVHTVDAAGALEAVAPDLIFPAVGFPSFALLVAIAFGYVRKSDYHKRYMLLATFSALDAPVARWILFDGHDRAGFAEGMVATLVFEFMLGALVLVDWRVRGRVHPACLVGGGILIAGQLLRLVLGPSAWWAAAIHWLPPLLGT